MLMKVLLFVLCFIGGFLLLTEFSIIGLILLLVSLAIAFYPTIGKKFGSLKEVLDEKV